MKLSKLKVIALIVTGVLLLGICGAVFYASSLIKPEEIRKITLEQIQKNFPNSEAKLGKIELFMGLSVGLELESLDMRLKKSKGGHELLSVKNLNVKIPVWSILMGGGAVDVRLDKPHLSYIENKKTNNWQSAMLSKKKKRKKISKSKQKSTVSSIKEDDRSSLMIPALISQSKINIKFTDVKVNYKLRDKSKGEVFLRHFVVKNLNFKTDSAFELDSKLDYKLANKQKLNVNALVIGHFNLREFIETQQLKSLVVIKLNDITLSDSGFKIPNINTDLNLLLEKNGNLSGDLKTKFNGAGSFSTKYFVKKKGMSFKSIKVNFLVKELVKISGQKIDGLSAGNSSLDLRGDVLVTKRKGVVPTLEFKLTEGLILKNQGVSIPTQLDGNVRGEAIKFNVHNKLLGGKITTNVFTRFNLNKVETDFKKVAPINVRIGLRDIDLSKKYLQGLLYAEKKAEKKLVAKGKLKTKSVITTQKSPPPVLPSLSLNLKWTNIKVDKNDFSGEGIILVKGNSVVTKKLHFNYSKGEGNITQSTSLLANGSSKTLIDMKIKKLNLDSFRAFLPPKLISNIKGTFSGSVKGNLSLRSSRTPKYELVTNISAVNGELVGINISEHVQSIISSIPIVKDKFKKDKNYKIDGTFEKLTFKGKLSDQHYNLKNYYFLGIKKSVEIKGNGHLYPDSKRKKGSLLLSFTDNTGKISAPMLKNIGTKILPIKMTGFGFDLKPDYAYTIKKVGKAAYKKKGKQVTKKQIEKLKKKYLKGDGKKKINKLLKGLFK